jgi:hypothetical protein
MAGFVPGIHVFPWVDKAKTWMPGTSLGMTSTAFESGRPEGAHDTKVRPRWLI